MYIQRMKPSTLFRVKSFGQEWMIILLKDFQVEAWLNGKCLGQFEISPNVNEMQTFYLFQDGPMYMIYPEKIEISQYDPMRCVACKEVNEWKEWIDRKCPACGYDPYGKGTYYENKMSQVPTL